MDDFDALELGHVSQRGVVGHDCRAALACKRDDLRIDLVVLGVELLDRSDLRETFAPDRRQGLETAARALPADRIGRVGDPLCFLQHERRHKHRAADQPRAHVVEQLR